MSSVSDFTPPPRPGPPNQEGQSTPANGIPPVALFHKSTPPPAVEELIDQIVDVTCCSRGTAEKALARCKGVVEDAVDEVLLKLGGGPVLLVICFCPVQETYFTNLMKTLPAQACFAEADAEQLRRNPVRPYYVRYDEYVTYARSLDWVGFFDDVIVKGEFALVPHDPAARGAREGLIGAITTTDSACPLIDYINERLLGVDPKDTRRCTLGNPYASFEWRQCKNAMHARLQACGLAYMRSIRVRTVEEAAEFIATVLETSGAVVVKPAKGAGSEFVTLCTTYEEAANAFAIAADLETTQQCSTEWMVVQEYVDGAEYVVDTVSMQSTHVLTDLWLSKKVPYENVSNRLRTAVEKELAAAGVTRPAMRSTSLLYDRLDFVPDIASQDAASEPRRVVAYTLQVLDALEHINGCAHCEVRVRPNGDPVLIEINSRMQGDVPRSTNLVGYDQYLLCGFVAHVVAASVFSADPTSQPEWATRGLSGLFPPLYRTLGDTDKTRSVLFLRVAEDGYVAECGRKYVCQLQTFVAFTRSAISQPPTAGYINRTPKTTDLYSCPAAVVLEGSVRDIEDDVRTIRLMENNRVSNSGWIPLLRTASDACVLFQRRKSFRLLLEAEIQKRNEQLDEGLSIEPKEAVLRSSNGNDDLRQYAELLDEPPENQASRLQSATETELSMLAVMAQEAVERSHARALRSVRHAKAFLAEMQPPPLFISTAEWKYIYGAHCGAALGA